jgi:Ni,Fe-hydrogenase III small subunit
MKASLLKKIKRSAYVYRVDCGGCNGCEIEIFATLSPLFDAERFDSIFAWSDSHQCQ